MSSDDEIIEFTITAPSSSLGGNGARIGYSDDFPGKQFLIFPEGSRVSSSAGELPDPPVGLSEPRRGISSDGSDL